MSRSALRRLFAIGASSSQTSKTRSKSARSKSFSDRMSLPEEASHRSLSFCRFTPVNSTATRSSSPTAPASRRASRPARPAEPVGSTSMPVASTARAFAAGERLLVDDDGSPAGREHPLDDCEPVVGLVVEDAVGDRVRLLLPRPHELGAVAGRVVEVAAGDDGVERPLQRPRAFGLDGVDARHGAERAERNRLLQPADDTRSRARRRRPGRRGGRSGRPQRRARTRASGRPRRRGRSGRPGT